VKHCIAVANQKGGVGKTTSCINLAACVAALDREVLVVDLDPQGNATTGLGVDKHAVRAGSYELLMGEAGIDEVMRPTAFDGVFLVPATMDLAGAAVELVDAEARERRLRRALAPLAEAGRFDYVWIDCPPSLNLLTINALAAASRVLVPLQCEFFAMEGLAQLMDTIRRVRAHLNPRLVMLGILLTMVDRRSNLTKQVEDEVRGYFGAQVLSTVIPRNVRLSEAPSFGKPALYYDLRAPGTQAYLRAAQEVLARCEEGR